MHGKKTELFPRIDELDGLRGLLAWWVAIGHFAYTFGDRWGEMSSNGSAVQTFIILSGFVITYLLDVGKESYGTFITRRFFRLFPVYFVLLILSALTLPFQANGLASSIVGPEMHHNALRLEVIEIAQADFWRHFLLHLSMLHGVVPDSYMHQVDSTFLTPAWSLSLEWQFYLIAPAIMWMIRRSERWHWLALIGAVLYLASLLPGYKAVSSFLPFQAHFFAFGIASYFFWKFSEYSVVRKALPWILVLFFIDQFLRGNLGSLVWAIVFASLVKVGPSILTHSVRDLLNTPLLQHLGKQSYPLYLCHMLFYQIALFALQPLGPQSLLWDISIVLASIGGSYTFAELLHVYIEKPTMAYSRRFKQ